MLQTIIIVVAEIGSFWNLLTQLMAVFTYGDENYTKAVSIISRNAHRFPPNILFDIACKNIKQKVKLDGNKRAGRRTVIREEVAMLESYVQRSDAVPEDKLYWLCKVFCRVSGTSKIWRCYEHC